MATHGSYGFISPRGGGDNDDLSIWQAQVSGDVASHACWVGDYPNGYSSTCFMHTFVTIDFGVWPVGPGHSAGVVWTDDEWETVHDDRARWVRNTNNDFGGLDESWSVTIYSHGDDHGPTPIWYALYVEDADGRVSWDNNDGWNYAFDLAAH